MEATTSKQEIGQPLTAESGLDQKPLCLNCGTPVTGKFCAACGQRDVPAYPTTRELAIDAVTELSGWDGRLAITLRTLLTKPGQLTREFLEGRRKSFISPMRLYLAASVAYFVLAAGAPEVRLESGEALFFGIRGGTPAPDPNNPDITIRGGRISAEDRAILLAEIDSAPALIQPFLRKSIDDPEGMRRRVLQALPKIFFVLLPAFALIVSVFYRKRKLPEHMYFAIHLHAFLFVALALLELVKYTGIARLAFVVGILSVLSIPVYATIAFRRVYGGSLVVTLLKEAGIGLIYGVLAFAGYIATMLWVAL